jgi:hypothetical protein
MGIDLPYFSAPPYDAGGSILDETLDVDLSFLQGSDYTFFTVERRWADGTVNDHEYIFGTTMPLPIEQMNLTGCTSNNRNTALIFGYVYYNPTVSVSLVLDQACNEFGASAIPVADGGLPVPLSEHAGEFAAAWGHQIWENGHSLTLDNDTSSLTVASDGAIGRALLQTTGHNVDPRFRGDIAEVIVYDTSLTGADRDSVDKYLINRWLADGGL